RDFDVTGVQTCALPILGLRRGPTVDEEQSALAQYLHDPVHGLALGSKPTAHVVVDPAYPGQAVEVAAQLRLQALPGHAAVHATGTDGQTRAVLHGLMQ